MSVCPKGMLFPEFNKDPISSEALQSINYCGGCFETSQQSFVRWWELSSFWDFSYLKLPRWNRCCKYESLLECFLLITQQKAVFLTSQPHREGLPQKLRLGLLSVTPAYRTSGHPKTSGLHQILHLTQYKKPHRKKPMETQEQCYPGPLQTQSPFPQHYAK